ncbi:MAG TPA: hypothetical protein VLS89_16935, partial [Candidatus Nanopelagicales bacterium]|nr:hypothetical protein [Candidatus Nanopelagicales bacterium]
MSSGTTYPAPTTSSGPGTGGGGGGVGGGGGAGGGTGGGATGECLPASGPGTEGSEIWQDAPHEAVVEVQGAESCARTYVLSTTGPLRDNQPANPRTIAEQPGQPVVRTGHAMFDALYAMAVEETR